MSWRLITIVSIEYTKTNIIRATKIQIIIIITHKLYANIYFLSSILNTVPLLSSEFLTYIYPK